MSTRKQPMPSHAAQRYLTAGPDDSASRSKRVYVRMKKGNVTLWTDFKRAFDAYTLMTMCRRMRSYLASKRYHDIDMVNSHPGRMSSSYFALRCGRAFREGVSCV